MRVGNVARQYGSLRKIWRGAIFCVLAALVASCSSLLSSDDKPEPDVLDKVRALDLLPRSPQKVISNDKFGGDPPKARVYGGAEVETIAAASPRPGPSGDGYDLNFENTPVAQVAKVVLGDILGTGYTIDPRVQGSVSLASARPVPKSDLVFVLENALRVSGVALVRDTQGYRLIPVSDAVGAGNIDSAPSQAEPGYGISVVPLQYVSASTLIKLLDSFATKAGTVRADAARNLLLIQGPGPERRAAIETALSFDVDWMRGQSVGIYPVQNSNPEPMITELEKILDTGENGLGHDVVKFVPVARMNAILVVSRKPSLLQTAAKWIQRLDNADTSRAGVHVYRIRYGEARQMARVLNETFVGGSSASLDTAADQVAPGSGLSTTSSGGLTPSSEGFGTSGGGFNRSTATSTQGSSSFARLGGLEQRNGANAQGTAGAAAASTNAAGANGPPLLPGVRITADTVNNALLIYATQEYYRIIERTVRQLDRPQMQVAIDATIAEVTLNDSLSYGVQAFLQSQTFGFKPDQGSVLNVPSSPPGVQPTLNATTNIASAFLNRAFPGFNFLIGPESQPNAILDALRAVTDLKVLSNPSLVVIDNQPATLMVGSDVPISTGSANVLTTSNTIVNTIDYRTVGIILRVVPRINVNGNVRLDIEQEISQVANGSSSSAAAASNSLTPTVSERKVRSSISVANGQTVLLAGLIQEQKEVDRSGIPILEQIPTFGDAFSHQTKSTSRTELIVFIRPQIIRDGVDAHFVAEELRSKLRGTLGTTSGNSPAPKHQ